MEGYQGVSSRPRSQRQSETRASAKTWTYSMTSATVS